VGWDVEVMCMAGLMRRPDMDGMIRAEEFHDDGTLVVRADLPGIDPEKDVELTVSDGMLRIEAERREEQRKEDKGYLRQELRTGLCPGRCRCPRA
jgi:HSP20 family molecular chaperone IbpA